MNEQLIRAGFLRRSGAVLIDVGVIFVLATILFAIWATRALGGLPETPAEFAAVMEAGQSVIPDLFVYACVAYIVASWTPLLGRRSIGMRQFGIVVVRDPR
jgi:hypothetical protein